MKLNGLLGSALAAILWCQVGCSQPSMTEMMRLDMSPEFETVALSHEQRMIRQARAMDTTARQLHDDWDQFWLLRRPLRMTVYSIP